MYFPTRRDEVNANQPMACAIPGSPTGIILLEYDSFFSPVGQPRSCTGRSASEPRSWGCQRDFLSHGLDIGFLSIWILTTGLLWPGAPREGSEGKGAGDGAGQPLRCLETRIHRDVHFCFLLQTMQTRAAPAFKVYCFHGFIG